MKSKGPSSEGNIEQGRISIQEDHQVCSFQGLEKPLIERAILRSRRSTNLVDYSVPRKSTVSTEFVNNNNSELKLVPRRTKNPYDHYLRF